MIKIQNSGVPWLLQLLFMYVNRFGKAVGQTHLGMLKKLAEEGPAPDFIEH